MKKGVCLLLMIWSSLAYGQESYLIRCDTINKIDKQGKKQGIWKDYRADGSLLFQHNYVNGVLEGPSFHYENEDLNSLEFYQNDKNTGWVLGFIKNKLISSSYPIDSSGYNIINEYYDNQSPKTGGNYHAGSGQLVNYLENGTVQSIYTYINFKLDGNYSEFFLNGQLKEHGVYKKDIPWSVYCAFDSLGQTKDVGTLLNGTGTLKSYYRNGRLQKTATYRNGNYWNTIECYAINGTKLDNGSIKDGEGIMLDYYESGTLKSSTSFNKGIRNGEYTRYNENAIIVVSGQYLNGREDGDWDLYNTEGKLIATYHYIEGNMTGISDYD